MRSGTDKDGAMAPAGQNHRGRKTVAGDIAGQGERKSEHSADEAFFESLFRSMPQASTIWRLVRDKKGTPKDLVVVAANEAFVQLFGAPDPAGRELSKWDPDLSKREPDLLDICFRVAATGVPETHQAYYATLEKWFEGLVSRIDEDLLFAQVTDVTERKLADKTSERAQYSLDHVTDYLTWLDREGLIVEVSDPTCHVLGFSRDELLAMTVFDIDPALSQREWRKNWNQTKKRGTYVIERQHRAKSGRVFPVEISATYLVFEGQEFHCGFCRDISERRQMEEVLNDEIARRKLLVEQSSDGIVVLNQEGAVVEANEEYARQLGYSLKEVLRLHVWDWQIDYSKEELLGLIERVDASGDHFDTRHRRKDGTFFDVDISSSGSIVGGQKYVFCVCRDVTERRRVEESLRLTQFSVDHAPDLIFWLTEDGRIVFANQTVCQLLGYTPDEMRSMRIWDIDSSLNPKDWPQVWDRVAAAEGLLHEESLHGKDGKHHAVEILSNHVEYGGIEYGVAVARDISERKEAEEALRDSEERYRRVFELETDAIVLADDDSGAILDVNDAACRLYGYARTELLSMSDEELVAEHPPADAHLPELGMEPGYISWHRSKDGKVFPVETHEGSFEWTGHLVRVTTIRDLSDLRQAAEELEESKQMLRLVLDTVPLRIGWRDRELRFLGCNVALAEDAGLPRPEAILGRMDEDLPVFNTTESYRDDCREVMGTGTPKLQYQETVVNSRGETRVLQSSKVPLRDRSGQIMGVLCIYDNVTDQTETIRALQEREEQLRQSQKMEAVGRLAGGIAHDFNNVLTTIIGYSDLILSSPDCPEGSLAEDVREIKAAAERAGSLTRQVLAFSRRQALEPAVLSLNTVVLDTERLLARTIGADIELRTSLSPDLGQVEVDEQQFVQVLLNLAVNARDAMPQGGILTLETANVELDEHFCKTHPDANPGSYAVLSVTDTGTGMDEDTLAHVFEPFYTTKPPGEGTGLGLSTVYGLVAQSGGCTYAHSRPGEGTTFTIYLPRVREREASEESEAVVHSGDGTPAVMVVEDDAASRGLTTRILERHGYNVRPMADAEQALVALDDPSVTVDILLTGVVLPGSLQGDELARSAVEKRPGLPVLFMSAHARDTMILEERANEQVVYLEKPFTAGELITQVQKCLGD